LLQRPFQKNKDCNKVYSFWAKRLCSVAATLPEKQGLQLYFTSNGTGSERIVAATLPEKQGLQLHPVI